MMSLMPKTLIDLMSRLGTVPNSPITTGILIVSTWVPSPEMLGPETFQSSVLTTLKSLVTAKSMIVHFKVLCHPHVYGWLQAYVHTTFCLDVLTTWMPHTDTFAHGCCIHRHTRVWTPHTDTHLCGCHIQTHTCVDATYRHTCVDATYTDTHA